MDTRGSGAGVPGEAVVAELFELGVPIVAHGHEQDRLSDYTRREARRYIAVNATLLSVEPLPGSVRNSTPVERAWRGPGRG